MKVIQLPFHHFVARYSYCETCANRRNCPFEQKKKEITSGPQPTLRQGLESIAADLEKQAAKLWAIAGEV